MHYLPPSEWTLPAYHHHSEGQERGTETDVELTNIYHYPLKHIMFACGTCSDMPSLISRTESIIGGKGLTLLISVLGSGHSRASTD